MNLKATITNIFKTLKQLSWRVFTLLLVVSCALWLTSKLSHRYVAEISIPIEFNADYKAEIWVQKATKNVRFMVEGEGGNLLLYKMGLGHRIIIPISSLSMSHMVEDDKYLYTIGEESLIRALTSAQNDFSITMMTDTLPKVLVSPVEERKIAVASRVHINCADQFMVVGGVQIVPDSVSFKAPSVVLDSIKVVYTAPLTIENCTSSQSGAVDLELPSQLISFQEMVRYEAIVQGFTERQYRLPINVANAPNNSFTVPRMVDVVVRIPMTDYFGHKNPQAHIDIVEGEKYSKIIITGLPQQSKIVHQEPEFAQFFTIEQ